jgi:hypothetical protein
LPDHNLATIRQLPRQTGVVAAQEPISRFRTRVLG